MASASWAKLAELGTITIEALIVRTIVAQQIVEAGLFNSDIDIGIEVASINKQKDK